MSETHPMGEQDKPKKIVLAHAASQAMVVDTMGGRMRVRWDENTHKPRRTANWCSLPSFWPPPAYSIAGLRPVRSELQQPQRQRQT